MTTHVLNTDNAKVKAIIGGVLTDGTATPKVYGRNIVSCADSGSGVYTVVLDKRYPRILYAKAETFGDEDSLAPNWTSHIYSFGDWAAAPAVVPAGTTPPVVTMTGTPNTGKAVVISISTGGARGTAKFGWTLGGVAQAAPDAVTTAATVVLGDTGLTANFATGTNYSTNNVYTATPVDAGKTTTSVRIRVSKDGALTSLSSGMQLQLLIMAQFRSGQT